MNEGAMKEILLDGLPYALQDGLYEDGWLIDEEVIQAKIKREERVENVSDKLFSASKELISIFLCCRTIDNRAVTRKAVC